MQTFKFSGIILLSTLFAFLFIQNPGYAQNWDAKQQEVWKNVVAYNDLFSKGQVNAFMNYFDPSYTGWSYEHEKPGSVEDVKKGVNDFFYAGNKVTAYKANPLAIRVFNDFAFVDYTITGTMVDKAGNSKPDNERWTDILMKKGGKWVLIGDQGGELAKLKITDSVSGATNNWDDGQMEILNAEKAFDEAYQNQDIDKMKTFYDPGYIDFSYDSEKPNTKDEVINGISKFFNAGNKVTAGTLMPLSINMHGDFAFIDYIISGTVTDNKGNTRNDIERWTDVLQKQNGKWVIVGDHGGAMPMKK